jgi:hypothetical protein
MKQMPPRRPLFILLLTLTACTPTAAQPSTSPRPTASPSVAAIASYPACTDGGAAPAGTRWTVAAGLNQPDDLLYAGGELYIAELGAGGIDVLAPGRPQTKLPVQLAAVEGMVFLGGDFYVAGQAADAVYQVQGSTLRKVIQLSPVAGQDGVDGIAAQSGLLIVPDSPRGVVDWVDPATGAIRKQVTGFVRPTGAWPLPGGDVLIADEYGNSVVRVSPSGAKTYLTRNLAIADDVAADSQGAVFVVAPVAGGGRLAQVLPDGTIRNVLTGLAAPQGLAVDGADNLYFSEEDAGRVGLLVRTFKLAPLPPVAGSSTQPVCVHVRRAPGFTEGISLSGGDGVRVLRQPGAGDEASVLVSGCPAAGCELTAEAGGRTDVLWIRSV